MSEAQIALVLKQAEDSTTIGKEFRTAGISDATFYAWRKKCAGLMPSEMRRLRQLKDGNAKLRRMVANLNLDKAVLQDVVSRTLRGLIGGVSSSTTSGASGPSVMEYVEAKHAALLDFLSGGLDHLGDPARDEIMDYEAV